MSFRGQQSEEDALDRQKAKEKKEAGMVTIEVDKGDAIAASVFLRQAVQRVIDLVEDMPADRQEHYLEQPGRWDRIAIALGEAGGEVDLKPLGKSDEPS